MIKRLESIELQGVKTFATSTRLEFPGKITAIVGPNGSGKSNIADSVRWVLGEQSYSMLRAKRTEDMIFSGSQQRSRAGMASATIIFNNEDGWLPIDFSEVSISRRAYRDGQNEYLLNGQKVRLRDIAELLSQTGLSERTYTIIGQGLVDAALSLKPDERRMLFEEAAGIGLYRTRKEESLRRLESTRQNLNRVLDIIAEIRPRMRNLEKQAIRLSEYQVLRSDLQDRLGQWYGFHWNQKQQDLRNSQNSFKDQEKRLLNLRQKSLEVTNQLEESRTLLQHNRKSLETAYNELSIQNHLLEQTTREQVILEERHNAFSHQRNDLEVDFANTLEELKELETQTQEFSNEIAEKTRDFNLAELAFIDAGEKLSKVTASKEKLVLTLGTLNQQNIALETEKVQLTAHFDELKNRINNSASEIAKIEKAKSSLTLDINRFSSQVSEVDKILGEKGLAFSKLQSLFKEKVAQLELKKTEISGLQQKIELKSNQIAKIETQIDLLEQAEAALSGYSQGSKDLIGFSRQGVLPKGIEPLSKYFIVEEKFEKAISASLGELTDLLIMPSDSENIVLEFLETKDSDRVALVRLNRKSKSRSSKKTINHDGFLGYATELIESDPNIQPLVDDLFSGILIFKDKKSAEDFQPELAAGQKAVTLNGLVFQSNGILIAGQNPSGKRIGRTRKIIEMQRDLQSLSNDLANLHSTKDKLSGLIDGIQHECESLEEALETAQIDKAENELKRQDLKEKIKQTNGELSWLDQRLADLQLNVESTSKQMEAINEQINQASGKISAVIDEINLANEKLKALPVFEVENELNHWRTSQIVSKNALEAVQQRFLDHQNRVNEVKARVSNYQNRLTSVKQRLVEIDEEENTLKQRIDALNQKIEEIKTNQIDPNKITNGDLDYKVSALQKLEEHHQQEALAAERQYTQYQLELTRCEDKLNNLREKIESDFGLVSFDYDQKIEGPNPLPFEDGLIENLPSVSEIPENIEVEIKQLKGQIRRIGAVNPEAQEEYHEVKERFDFLTEQIADLEKASKDLHEVINELDSLMERDFLKTFKSVNIEFSHYFTRLFNGGEAKLVVSDEENPVEGGVDIEARLPGRRQQGLALLSGGERSLTAVALIFALLKVSPTPFCILDEVDAMLDESNVGRFVELLRELSKSTQFVLITHNRNTVQAADVIYGVTMGRDSTSQMISLKLEDVDETYVE
jgi:chromosome segregation protein